MGVVMPVGFGICKLKWAPDGATEDMISTFGYDGDVAEDPAVDAAEVNAIMVAATRPCLPANYSSSWRWRGVECVRMTATGPITGVSNSSVLGGTSMSTCPPNTSFLLRKNTARGGRKGFGHMFLPPIWVAENNVDTVGVIAGGNLTSTQNMWNSALTALLASDVKPVLLHSDGSTPDPITTWTIESVVATQRRRLRR